MKITTKLRRDEIRLLPGLTFRLGDLAEVRLHPSGSRFDGAARIVGAFTTTTFEGRVARTSAFLKLVAVEDRSRRIVVQHVATSLGGVFS